MSLSVGPGLLGAVVALVAAASLASAAAAAPGTCPDTRSVGQVQDGDTGTGWTVVRGTAPKAFDVEIIGTYPDGLLPGHDIIIARISDAPGETAITDAGGAWAGMSGSPVYIGSDLIGAIAYGFSTGPSKLVGITPIDEMLAVADDVEMASAPARLSPAAARELRRAAPNADASSFRRLPVPIIAPTLHTFRMKGGTAAARERVKRVADTRSALRRAGFSLVVAGTETTIRPSLDPGVPGGGDNLAVTLSTGDTTVAGVGTMTWTCGDKALAFGHPMLMDGPSNLGAHHARAIDIVDDPAGTPFKMTVPGALVGKVVDDRLTAIGVRLDRTPRDTLAVTSTVTDGARTHQGSSTIDVATPSLRSSLVGTHALNEVLAASQRDGNGSVAVRAVLTGTRDDGQPFSTVVADRWLASDGPIGSFYTFSEAAATAASLFYAWIDRNPVEEVAVTSVDLDISVGDAKRWTIEEVLVKRNDGPFTAVDGGRIRARHGDVLTVRFRLAALGVDRAWQKPGPNSQRRDADIVIRVPWAGGALVTGHGTGLNPLYFEPEGSSFEEIQSELGSMIRSDELYARIGERVVRLGLDRVIEGRRESVPIVRPGS